jgi:hypothetical protein
MKRRSTKRRNSLKKYTAYAPKTLRATKAMGTAVVKKIGYIFNAAAKTIKKTTKMIDKKTSKSIRSFTKKASRK